MSLVDISFVTELLDVESQDISSHYIDLAEAKAKELIGYLEVVTKKKSFYIFNATTFVNLDEPNAILEEISYRSAGGADYTVIAENTYRFLVDKGLIVFNAAQPEDSEVLVEYTIGWTRNTLPKIVKLLIVLLTVEVLNQFKPGTVVQSEIKSKKIGDYTITYASDNSGKVQEYSIKDIDKLVTLIKQGTFESTSQL